MERGNLADDGYCGSRRFSHLRSEALRRPIPETCLCTAHLHRPLTQWNPSDEDRRFVWTRALRAISCWTSDVSPRCGTTDGDGGPAVSSPVPFPVSVSAAHGVGTGSDGNHWTIPKGTRTGEVAQSDSLKKEMVWHGMGMLDGWAFQSISSSKVPKPRWSPRKSGRLCVGPIRWKMCAVHFLSEGAERNARWSES
ncbi:hypothetical protein CGCSCA4_v003080 [Colletotrichum siamense]|uniref:Uncharacterized protein n=1 Tax=Colletotrichum siamense TaxID=690259 RepID=A0A9P5EDI6_COLSI|nr:hypothetical protein CGCSCA2_v014001 [Colletotrichum siamense]KAF4852009.1 hypothetical protein CGCSCA4_v003080 [Colletotrichum siamense]